MLRKIVRKVEFLTGYSIEQIRNNLTAASLLLILTKLSVSIVTINTIKIPVTINFLLLGIFLLVAVKKNLILKIRKLIVKFWKYTGKEKLVTEYKGDLGNMGIVNEIWQIFPRTLTNDFFITLYIYIIWLGLWMGAEFFSFLILRFLVFSFLCLINNSLLPILLD